MFNPETLAMTVELGDRRAGVVGHQGEQGAFDIEAKMARIGSLANNCVDTKLLPNGLKYVDVAVGPGADQLPVTPGSHDLFR